MPSLGTFYGYAWSDFSFSGTNSGLITNTNNGPFGSLVDGVNVDITDTAILYELEIDDDDPELEDGFQETGGAQTVIGTGTTLPGISDGDTVESEYTFVLEPVGGGPTIEIYAMAIGPNGFNSNPTVMFLSSAELDPLTTYVIVSSTDGGDLPFVDVYCFGAGTHIQTPNGEIRIENLKAGDSIIGKDGGHKTLRWVGSKRVKAERQLAPIIIQKHALGNHSDLILSPQHRVLIQGWRAELLFGMKEVLVPAKALLNGDTIYRRAGGWITYYHLLFDTHEIVYSNGVPSESFHPAQYALTTLDLLSRREVFEIFPELSYGQDGDRRPACGIIPSRDAIVLSA
ncbi:MAG: Hint domain-containing protein [Pseudomonadota bacterium]